jgi:platelet-activating factor acetylhydrolase IB subunit beta/gamma
MPCQLRAAPWPDVRRAWLACFSPFNQKKINDTPYEIDMRVWGPLISAIVCITPAPVFAQICSDQDLTTTPAPPPSPRSYRLYLEQLLSAVDANVDLILLGDSLAELWDTKMLQPISVVNLGVGGDRTQNVLWRLESPRWSKLRPRAVFIMLGTNNLPNDNPCAVIASLKRVIERVKSIWPLARVILLEITPRGKGFLEYNSARVEINAAMRNVLGIETVNVDDEITCGWKEEDVSGACPNYLPDHLHFSTAGYEIILKSLRATLFGK